MSSASRNAKPKAGTPRWNLQSIPKVVHKETIDYLVAHRSYAFKLLGQRKLKWRKENGFVPKYSQYRDGGQIVKTINDEAAQKKCYEPDMDTKLKYLEKHIQQAKVSMNEKLKALTKRIDLFSNNMKHFMEELAGPQNVFMDDDEAAGDPWDPFDEVRESEHRTIIKAIALARETTYHGIETEYQRWEQNQQRKSVTQQTRVQNQKVYVSILRAKEYENNDKDMDQLHAQVRVLTKAMERLMTKKDKSKNSNKPRRKNTSIGGGKSHRGDRKRMKGKKKSNRRTNSESTRSSASTRSGKSSSSSKRSSMSSKSSNRSEKRKRESLHHKGPSRKNKRRERRDGKRQNVSLVRMNCHDYVHHVTLKIIV